MTRKKVEPVNVDSGEVAEEPRTRQVSRITREVFEEPIVEEVEVTETGETWADPFGAFSELATANQSASLRIWRLPNYELDGRTSPSGTEREYCGSVTYNQDDTSGTLDLIHQRVPMGGAVLLELYSEGRVRKHGLLKLVKAAVVPGAAPSPAGYPHFVINQPAQAAAGEALKPAEQFREQLGLLREVAETIDALHPTTTAPAPEQPSLQDRILESVIVKMVENPKAEGLDRIADILTGGRREPAWWEIAMPDLIKSLAPAANALLMRLATFVPNQTSAPTVTAASQNGQQEPTAGGQAVPAQLAPDPAQRAWFKIVIRMLEDCSEHVELRKVSADGLSVEPAAYEIANLTERFPDNQQLIGTIGMLLESEPGNVFELCKMLVRPEQHPHLEMLKESEAAQAWIKELQVTAKQILNESGEPADTDEEPDSMSAAN